MSNFDLELAENPTLQALLEPMQAGGDGSVRKDEPAPSAVSG
jgi:hypothetical protein